MPANKILKARIEYHNFFMEEKKIKENDIVYVKTENHPIVCKGDKGTIVHVYKTKENVFEVEFSTGRKYKSNPKTVQLKASELSVKQIL